MRCSWICLGLVLILLLPMLSCGDSNGERETCTGGASGGGTPDTEISLPQGLYDFYGTFSDNPAYADGSGSCAIPEPLGCPSVTNFCIYRLTLGSPDSAGVQMIRGCSETPGDAFYDPACETDFWNVAVGRVYMMPFILSDWDGGGQVRGNLDSCGGIMNAASETRMVVEKEPGLFPSWRIASWSTSLEASPLTPPGTVVLTIPYKNNLKPPPPDDSPPGTYDPPASTTHQAVCRVTNPETAATRKEASGTPLMRNRTRMVTPHSILRTMIGGIIPMGSDVMSITTWDGTFCRRTDPDLSCVPEEFACPDLYD